MKNQKPKKSKNNYNPSAREYGDNRHWEAKNDSKFRKSPKPASKGHSDGGAIWFWGTHAVDAAVKNPNREIIEILATKNAASHLPPATKCKIVEPEYLTEFLPHNSVHQGIAARVKSLPTPDYDKAIETKDGFIFILDQLTDPQNIGSIFRTAAAFGAKAIIQQDRKAPPITGALAKAAQGGVELVADLRVVNIAQTINELSEMGFLTVGLTMDAEITIAKAFENETRPIAIVLGAEGRGLRQLVAQRCEINAKIPMGGLMESLNVSNAAAIAAYEFVRSKL